MKHMKRIFLAILGVVMIGVGSLSMAQPTYASDCDVAQGFLGFKPWYEGLCDANGHISPKPHGTDQEMAKFIWRIVLNITFDISLVVGYVALAMVVYGGYLYIMSQGDVSKTTKAKKSLTTAVIGTVIAMGASVIVNTLALVLTGSGVSEMGGAPGNVVTADTINGVFSWLYAAGGLVAVVFIIKSGFDYMMSRGDPGKMQQATRGLIFSIVGLLIVVLASVLTSFILEKVGGAVSVMPLMMGGIA